jgi:hypothetical protein
VTGKFASAGGKEAPSWPGEPGYCTLVWVSGKRAAKGCALDRKVNCAVCATEWITARKPAVSREAGNLCEGKALKGSTQERLWHETRLLNSDLLGNR